MPRVDLPSAFAAAASPDPARLFIDHMHPSVQGAAVMADAVTALLRQQPELLGLGPGDLR